SNRAYIWFHEGLKRRWAPALFALLFAYLGLSLVSHLLYNIQDVAGLGFKESGKAAGLAQGRVEPKADPEARTGEVNTPGSSRPTSSLPATANCLSSSTTPSSAFPGFTTSSTAAMAAAHK